MATNTAKMIVSALIEAGLPASSIQDFLFAFSSGSASVISAVPGVTEAVIVAATSSNIAAYTDAFHKVFFATIAFGSVSVLAAFLLKPFTKEELAGSVVYHLDHGKTQLGVEAAEVEQIEKVAPLE